MVLDADRSKGQIILVIAIIISAAVITAATIGIEQNIVEESTPISISEDSIDAFQTKEDVRNGIKHSILQENRVQTNPSQSDGENTIDEVISILQKQYEPTPTRITLNSRSVNMGEKISETTTSGSTNYEATTGQVTGGVFFETDDLASVESNGLTTTMEDSSGRQITLVVYDAEDDDLINASIEDTNEPNVDFTFRQQEKNVIDIGYGKVNNVNIFNENQLNVNNLNVNGNGVTQTDVLLISDSFASGATDNAIYSATVDMTIETENGLLVTEETIYPGGNT